MSKNPKKKANLKISRLMSLSAVILALALNPGIPWRD